MESLSTLEKIEISKLLLKVKDAGVTVKPGRDNSLLMTGPRDAGIVASLKDNKEKILALFKDPSHGIEQCVDRLRKGMRHCMIRTDHLLGHLQWYPNSLMLSLPGTYWMNG
mgnify:CR=1 FL=1